MRMSGEDSDRKFLASGPKYFVSPLLYVTGLISTPITHNERYHKFYAVLSRP
jgi:hypothetical protein